jgi:hypothetical protein
MLGRNRLIRVVIADKYHDIGRAKSTIERVLAVEAFVLIAGAAILGIISRDLGVNADPLWNGVAIFLGLQIIVTVLIVLYQWLKRLGPAKSATQTAEVVLKTFLYLLLPCAVVAVVLVLLLR